MRKFYFSPEFKKYFIVFSIFLGIIFGMTVLLTTVTLLSRNSWKAGLAKEVQYVLDTYSESQYTVSQNVPVKSMISTSAAVYTLLKKDDRQKQKYYGILVRIPSILGPLPAVFIYNEKEGVTFAGYAIDNGKASSTVNLQVSSTVIKYWEEMIPKIISKSEK